ncbi:MAG: hypothetical protein PHU85_12610 [Phycisphaerae bacterium]|nr:hypothetical protein [Phycisphaerae bacterium]
MHALEIIVLVSSVVAATLGVVAITLSLLFYRLASRLACGARESQQALGEATDRVGRLYDTLYREAIGIIKEQCVARPAQADPLTDQRLSRLKHDIVEGVSGLVGRLRSEQASEGEVSIAMTEIIDRAIAQSRKSE